MAKRRLVTVYTRKVWTKKAATGESLIRRGRHGSAEPTAPGVGATAHPSCAEWVWGSLPLGVEELEAVVLRPPVVLCPRFRSLCALRARTTPPRKPYVLWETTRPLNRPGRPRPSSLGAAPSPSAACATARYEQPHCCTHCSACVTRIGLTSCRPPSGGDASKAAQRVSHGYGGRGRASVMEGCRARQVQLAPWNNLGGAGCVLCARGWLSLPVCTATACWLHSGCFEWSLEMPSR